VRPGESIADRYEILRSARAGASGVVFEAVDRRTARRVAVKVIAVPRGDVGIERRMGREIRILAALSHPNIVAYHSSGKLAEGRIYVVLEWLSGQDLADFSHQHAAPLGFALALGEQVGSALAAAHEKGIIHRDIKPANIYLLDPDPRLPPDVRVIDFGVAKANEEGGEGLTRAGAILGTPAYMAPEQANHAMSVDARADVFSLGVVLFELIAGELPWETRSDLARLARILVEAPRPLFTVRPNVPEPVAELIDRMLALDPEARPQSMAEVCQSLAELRQTLPPGALSLSHQGGRAEQQRILLEPTAAKVEVLLPPEEPEEIEVRTEIGLSTGPEGAGGVNPSAGAIAALNASSPLVFGVEELEPLVPDPASVSRKRLPLVGRGPVLERLVKEADQALTAEQPTRVAIFGPAGIGKTRLRIDLTEALRKLASPPHVLAARADEALRSTPYGFLRRLLVAEAKIQKTDPPSVTARKLEALLPSKSEVSQRIRRPFLLTRGSSDGKSEERTRFAQIERWTERPSIAAAMTDAFDFDSAQLATSDEDQDRAMVLSFLAEALAVSLPKTAEVAAAKKDPRIMGAETRRSLDLALRTLAQRRGLVLLVDDAHFLDRQSASVLSALSETSEPLPIFTAIFALPSLLEEEAAGRGPWDLRRTLVLDLPPLDPPAARSFVRMVAGQPIRADAVEILAQRAEGNPLYLEHLVRAVIETAVVAPTKGGELSLVGLRGDSEDAERIPPSITAALRARLNVLDPNLLEVLSAAVVFGDVFWAEGVAEAIGRDIEETMIRVDRLVLADFVRRRPATRYPGLTEVELSHQVVRTVVLARLKQRDRRELERAVVGFLRQVGETDAATMAAHLVRAGYRQDAAELYRRAAQRSVDAGDFAAATLLSDEGLLLLESGAVDEITRVRLLGVAAVARNYARDHGRAKEALLSMLGLALEEAERAQAELFVAEVARADLDLPEAARFAQAALTRFVELGDRPGSLGAELILAETAEAETDDRAALKGYVRLSIALDPEVQKGELARTMAGLARIALASGDYRTAESRFRSALAYARAAFSVDALASALLGLGTLAQRQGAHQRALSFFEGAERLVPDADLAGELWARRALLEAEMGALEAAESQVEAALSELWRGGTSQAAIVPTLLWAELAICYSGPIGAATAELLSERLELMSQLAERAAPALVVPFDLLLGHALVVRGESARGLAMSQGALDRFGESGTLRELEAPLLFWIHSESLSRAGRGLPEIARAVTSAVRHLDELLGRLERGDRGQALARPPLARILERAAELELDVRHDARSHRLSIGGAND